MSGDEVSDVIELEDGETVEWVASTYANEQLINLFVCRAEGEPETVLATEHGDKGVCSQWAGRGGLWRPPRPRTGVCLRGGRTCEGSAAVLVDSPHRPVRQHGDGQHWDRRSRLSGYELNTGPEKSWGSFRGS